MLGATPKPTPARLGAELATLPEKPARPLDSVTYREASEILGVGRTRVRKHVKDGQIREVGRDGIANLLDRGDVEELASKRGIKKFERELTGPDLEVRRAEKKAGLLSPVDVVARPRPRDDDDEVSDARHDELLEATVGVKDEIELRMSRLETESRNQTRVLEQIRDTMQMLLTGLGVAAAAGVVAAVTPTSTKEEIKEKLAAIVRGKPSAPTVSLVAPVGSTPRAPAQTEERPALDDPRLKQIADEFSSLMDDLERQKT